MKKFLFTLLTLLAAANSWGQVETFENFDQIINKEFTMYDLQITLSEGNVLFRAVNGKLKTIPRKETSKWGESIVLKCSDAVSYKGSKYLRCTNEKKGTLYLKCDTKYSYIQRIRNNTVWYEYLEKLKNVYAYKYKESDEKLETKKYIPITWTKAVVPTTSFNDAVWFFYDIPSTNEHWKITYKAISENAHKFNIRTKDEFLKDKEAQEIEDSKRDSSFTLVVSCFKEHVYTDFTIDPDDSIYVYQANQETINGWYKTRDITLPIKDVYVCSYDKENITYLQRRKEDGASIRSEIAKKAAKEYLIRDMGRLIEDASIYLNELKRASSKQLFLKSAEYAYGDYSERGLKFRIFNCWNKTIKYVEFSATAYNDVGDIQRDWIGKSVANAKGIGPIDPLEEGSWLFDDMFYDKRGVISSIKPTRIKIIFTDGTSLSFNGYATIHKHRTDF
jgi:hypothetical protein